MKKVILFYGKTEENRDWHWMPINLLFLSSLLIKEGYDVRIIDERINPDFEDYLISLLPEALLLGISSFSGYQIKGGLKAAGIARKYRPDLLIAWGGAHPSSLPNQTIEDKRVDLVIRGQGEMALFKLVKAIESKSDFSDIQGLTSKKGDSVITNPSESFDINMLPKLPFHLLEIEKYINPQTRALNYTTSVGCNNHCAFCFWPSRNASSWQTFDSERILDDLERIVNKYQIKIIKFMDADFLVSENKIIEICNGILKRGMKFKWNFEARVDRFNEISKEALSLCEKSGLHSIFLGVESVSPAILKLMNKKISQEDVLRAVEKSRSFSFKLLIALIFALPTETMEDLKITADFIKKATLLNPRIDYQRSIFSPYPSTTIYQLAIKFGYKPPKSLEEWQNFDVQSEDPKEHLPWFSDSFLKEYKEELYKAFPDPGNYARHLVVD